LEENDPQINLNLPEACDVSYQQSDEISRSVSETYKSALKTTKPSEKSSITADQYKDKNQDNFITLSQILEQDKIEIIQLGFQLQTEKKISLKKYDEGTEK